MLGRGGPLVGRSTDLQRCLQLLAPDDAPGIVIVADPGVGRSRFLAAIADALPPEWVVQRVDALAGGTVEPVDATGQRIVLIVDDAHLLDEHAAAEVLRHVQEGSASAVLSCSIDGGGPAALRALWRDGVLAEHRLDALGLEEVAELAASIVDGDLDQTSVERLHLTSGGRPLIVRELIADAAATGALATAHGLVRWPGVMGGPRVRALVAAELDPLDAEGDLVVDALALAGSLPLGILRALADSQTLGSLERRRLLAEVAPGTGRFELRHPVHAAVRSLRMGPLQRADVAGRLLDAFAEVGAHDSTDRSNVARWMLDLERPVSPDECTEVAALAVEAGDLDLADRLLVDALGRARTPARELAHAEVLEALGRATQSAALLDSVAAQADRLRSDQERARLVSTRLRVATHGLRRPELARLALEAAPSIADPAWRGYVEAQWATLLAMGEHLQEAAGLADRLLANDDDRVRLRALPAGNVTAYSQGRYVDALALSTDLVGPALALREEVPEGVSVVFSALVIDLLALGRLGELDDLLALADAPLASSGANRAYVLGVRGSLALRRGRVAAAHRLLAESAARFGQADPQGYRAAVLSSLGQACALMGDREGAATAAAEAEAVRSARAPRFIDRDGRRCDAWASVAHGDVRSARRALVALAGDARGAGLVGVEVDCLHDAVRLGAGTRSIRRLAAVAASAQGERAAAMVAHARALLSGSAGALEEASVSFEQLGEDLLAAELAASAARIAREQGVTASARRLANRAQQLLGRCPGARLPVDPGIEVVALTGREMHIARLAAEGRSSQRIADQLGVSRRTVDNQLSRVYAKFGIKGRRELPRVLDLPEPAT